MPDVLSGPADQRQRSPRSPAAAQARRNRRWMLLMAMTPIVFAILYAVGAFTTGGAPEPVVHPLRTPAGYQAVTDAYYGFAIPKNWPENGSLSDPNGDFYYNGPGGWVGESVRIAKTSPGPSAPVPEALWAYGVTTPTKFGVLGGHRIHVPGTSFAWAVTLTRPDGSRAQAVDVWE
ncbi:MAG: hypothetical protein J2O47_02225, partial [Acidimicrobiaceae bacterium]|nr:hypothetical protein [Acidimicrobiaceae bacterium]